MQTHTHTQTNLKLFAKSLFLFIVLDTDKNIYQTNSTLKHLQNLNDVILPTKSMKKELDCFEQTLKTYT